MKKRRDLRQQLELARKFEQGSLSRKEFAKMHGVCLNAVDLWRRRLKNAEGDTMDAEFGQALEWERLDEKRAARISLLFDGGWLEPTGRETLFPKLIACMERLHAVLNPRAQLQAIDV